MKFPGVRLALAVLLNFALLTLALGQVNYDFTTVAGTAGSVINSIDATGAAAQFDHPRGATVDSAGNIYVADSSNHTIRKVSAAGVVTTLAGKAGSSGRQNGTGTAATFTEPFSVAVDDAGNVYVADTSSNLIRKITPAGVVTTLAGSGAPGGADGTGTAATFNEPRGVAVDRTGNVYVADYQSFTIRKITAAGVVTTLAGTNQSSGSTDGTGAAARFGAVQGVAVDSAGNVFVADTSNRVIRKITPAGVVTTFAGTAGQGGSTDGTGTAARFSDPRNVAVDSADNVYVAEYGSHTIRKITPAGVVTTLAGSAGNPGSTDATGTAARFNSPSGLTVDSAGNLYVADTENDTLRKISTGGVVTTLAGLAGRSSSQDGTGAAARFEDPYATAVDRSGNIYVADNAAHCIRKITPAGVVTTLAGLAGTFGSADGTGSAARFYLPLGVAVDSAGVVYVADGSNSTVRKITPDGVVTTLAGRARTSGSTDGTGADARFAEPHGIAVDTTGNVYVVDSQAGTLRKITPAGVVTTLAGTFGSVGSTDGTGAAARFRVPFGVAVDSAGNIFVCDHGNHTVRKVTPAGVVTTLAGTAESAGNTEGTGAAARFRFPSGLAVDANGNVFVADTDNQAIRKITSAGVVSTIGGAGRLGSTDGRGTAALFYNPKWVATDSSGNLYIADRGNHTIRKGTVVTVAAPTIGTSPVAQSIKSGSAVTFSVTATGSDLTYQWLKDGVAITGATASTYSIAAVSTVNAGSYAVTVSNAGGSVTSTAVVLTVISPSTAGRLVNMSVRTNAGTGNDTLIVGVSLGGTGTSGTMGVLLRAVGPTLTSYGVTGALVDPVMTIYNGSAVAAQNDDWTGSFDFPSVGAFPFGGSPVRDAAVANTAMQPATYSIQITGKNNGTGIALAEIYDITPAANFFSTSTRLVNVSARTQVGVGDNVLIAGFVIGGTSSVRVLIRAVGPTLASYGVTGTLSDPKLEIFRDGAKVAENDNWTAATAATFASVAAFEFLPGSRDAALVATLQPGSYTAQASGVNNATGVALVEVYELP